jgi:GntR family transcriptional regulator/MocR family aminotransferase
MVLPPALMEKFRRELGFYSCTVSSFEQYTLARFLSRGYFEKHINRMRKYYKMRRNQVVSALNSCLFADKLTIREEDAGLHFLLQVDTPMTDEALTAYCEARGIRVRSLSSYYHLPIPESDQRCLVINYAGVNQEDLDRVLAAWDQD